MNYENFGGVFIFAILATAVLVGAIVHIVDSVDHNFDVSNISPEERWGDLDNIAARDKFCKYKGYSDSQVIKTFGNDRQEFAGGPMNYDIICVKFVESSKIYPYYEYKQWLTSIEVSTAQKEE